ncbi:8-hydroxy-dADP phosphatase activity protein [Homalodisca vitripennis]|nr:8-hydroxy-dADP phosphatase activity protein [Homalodisca vitripennis]
MSRSSISLTNHNCRGIEDNCWSAWDISSVKDFPEPDQREYHPYLLLLEEPGKYLTSDVVRELDRRQLLPPTLSILKVSSSLFSYVNKTNHSLSSAANANTLAKWVNDPEQLSLRCKDILPVVERGHVFRTRPEPQHPNLLPSVRPHHKLLLRFVILVRQKSSNRVHILLSEKTEVHLPICEVNHHHNLHSTIRKFMVEIFGADVPPHKPHGVLNVEHCGKPEGSNDGLCMTILIAFRVPLEEVFPIDKYTWLMVSRELGDRLLQRVPRNLTVPLHVIS